jgi:hypothetical protein
MKVIMIFFMGFIFSDAIAQQSSYFDPAQAYNRLLIEKNNGTYTRVGNFRVIGTSYLYGEKNKGDIYGTNETGNDIFLSYDTYTQNVYFFPASSPGISLTKEPSSLDSFTIKKNPEASLEDDITFVYGTMIGATDKSYYQVIVKGKKANLYKRYKAELGMVSTNYIQSELRQFNILVEYYYTDSTGKGTKKLKIAAKNLAKEFASIKDLSSFINSDDLNEFRERELVRIFQELNRE